MVLLGTLCDKIAVGVLGSVYFHLLDKELWGLPPSCRCNFIFSLNAGVIETFTNHDITVIVD